MCHIILVHMVCSIWPDGQKSSPKFTWRHYRPVKLKQYLLFLQFWDFTRFQEYIRFCILFLVRKSVCSKLQKQIYKLEVYFFENYWKNIIFKAILTFWNFQIISVELQGFPSNRKLRGKSRNRKLLVLKKYSVPSNRKLFFFER